MKTKIIIVAGDPHSINAEIINKVWKKIDKKVRKKLFLIASFKLIEAQFKKLNSKIQLIKLKNCDAIIRKNCLKIIDVPLNFKNPYNVPFNNSSKYVINCLNLAHKLVSDKEEIKGIINCPINKKLIKSTKKIGVTELLASKNNIKKGSEVMMIHNEKISVVPLTTHIDLKAVSTKINSSFIQGKIIVLNKSYKKLFKKKPKIGVLGLNPHNSELKKGSEEALHIIPAIKKLKKKGLNISGPLVSDTTFIKIYKDYDVIVGMYHDQVLIPFKSLFHFDAINITLGLDYIRVSPDHGPAIDLIGKNKASSLSLLKSIKFINNLY
tara:strand:+ start:421 stop:1389 length:969 start_codon:yes stop_codon:yes gene_type:complete